MAQQGDQQGTLIEVLSSSAQGPLVASGASSQLDYKSNVVEAASLLKV
jgi:hypothetical protein